MEPKPELDKFRLREIEQQVARELSIAREKLRRASTEQEKQDSSDSYHRALQRFTDFVARGIVPKEFYED